MKFEQITKVFEQMFENFFPRFPSLRRANIFFIQANIQIQTKYRIGTSNRSLDWTKVRKNANRGYRNHGIKNLGIIAILNIIFIKG